MQITATQDEYTRYSTTQVKEKEEQHRQEKQNTNTETVLNLYVKDEIAYTTYDNNAVSTGFAETKLSLDEVLKNMKGCTEVDLPPLDENLSRELYAIRIDNGKIKVEGQKGFEAKVSAYEKLLNASCQYQYNWGTNGNNFNEATVLNNLTNMFKFYSAYDNQIQKANPKDSIANHVNDAFDSWYQKNAPRGQAFQITV